MYIMPKQLLRDVNIFPTSEVIHEALREASVSYEQFLYRLSESFPEMSLDWRYYKDGKAWLCKGSKRKKTIFWLSVWEGFFKLSFFFTEKTCSGVMDLEIAEELKMQLRNAAMIGKLIPLICDMSDECQLEDLFTVMKYKAALK
jgi:hypothetical protein